MYDAIVSWPGQAESLKIEKMRKDIPPSHSIFSLPRVRCAPAPGTWQSTALYLRVCVWVSEWVSEWVCVCVCVCVCECVSVWVCECVCVSVWVCECVSVRYQTPFSSRHESGQSLFLSTGKHQAVGQLPRVSFSALPWQSSDRPPTKTLSSFSFLSPVQSENALRTMQLAREATNQSFNVQTVK